MRQRTLMLDPHRLTRLICGGAILVGLVGCSCGKKTKRAKTSPSASAATPASLALPMIPPDRLSCPEFLAGRELGRVTNTDLTEASGLAVSPKNPSVLWSHNDSGNQPQLFAMTREGRDLGSYHLAKAKLEDWEDLAMGPAEKPGKWYFYVGDIGTNAKARLQISVFRIVEPMVELDQKPKKRKVEGVVRFDFTYPDQGVHNAETLMVDPRSGDLYLVTKPSDTTPTVYRAKAPLIPNAVQVLEEVAKLTVFEQGKRRSTLVTAGDISPDGSQILIRSYTTAYLWLRRRNESVADSLKRDPCVVPLKWTPSFGPETAWCKVGPARV